MTRTAKHFGFSRTKKIFVAFVTLLATVMLIVPITDRRAVAEDMGTNDLDAALLPYSQELEKLNEKLGTDYAFVTQDDVSEDVLNEMAAFFQQIGIDGFRNYIYELYNDDSEVVFDDDADVELVPEESIQTDIAVNSSNPTNTISQKYYYDGRSTSNNLYIDSTVMYGGNSATYLSVDYYGSTFETYPCYVVKGFKGTLSSDYRSVDCVFTCTKYKSEFIKYNADYNIPVTFEAAGSNVYAEVSV